MKKTLTATLLCSLVTPSFAGGPVIIEDENEVVVERPASSINSPVIPLLLLLAIGIAVASGSDDDATSDTGDTSNNNSGEAP